MEQDSAKVPLCILTETNWPIWKMRTMAYASSRKWEKILDGTINSRSFKQIKLNKFNDHEKSNIINDEGIDDNLEEEFAENYEDEKLKSKDTKIAKVYGLTFDQFDVGNRFLYKLIRAKMGIPHGIFKKKKKKISRFFFFSPPKLKK